METIKNYLDNMFANLSKTSEMLKLKNDIYSNMEEKYNEHKNDGKSENEATGIVISEFGNIDELIDEFGNGYKKEQTIQTFTQVEAQNNKFIRVVAAIVWPLAGCIFLITGFIFKLWYINWIIYPIAGIIFVISHRANSILK